MRSTVMSCGFGLTAAAADSRGAPQGWLTTIGGVGSAGGSRRGFEWKSNERAMLCAYASRRVSGPTPKRYSIIFRIDSNPNTPWCTYPRLTHGETATAGIRNPIWPKSLLMSRFIRMSGTRGGRTWSKKPPHSS